MSGEEAVGMAVVVADSVVEQEDGEVVVPLVDSAVGPEDEREAAGSVLEGRALEVAVSGVSVQVVSGWGPYGPV